MRATETIFNSSVSTLQVETTTAPEFIDITSRIAEIVSGSRIRNGVVLVFSTHTTAAVTIQEHEPLLLNDMADMLKRLASRSVHYRHNDFSIRTVHMEENESPNGHSHCHHLILGTSEMVPIIDGQLALGQWQRVFVVELDHLNEKPREIVVPDFI